MVVERFVNKLCVHLVIHAIQELNVPVNRNINDDEARYRRQQRCQQLITTAPGSDDSTADPTVSNSLQSADCKFNTEQYIVAYCLFFLFHCMTKKISFIS